MKNQGTEIKLMNCAKTYKGGIKALFETDLTIKQGEILALLGPSGCGKTTMLRIIAGLQAPDKGGVVMFDNDDVTNIPIEKRQTGIVFQSYALFPNMSVEQNIAYGLKLKKMKKAEINQRVEQVLSLCKLNDYAKRSISDLSGGQQQRVALARAVAPSPRVLLLDEPLSALDASLREHLQVELSGLLREFNTTAIMVTHDQSEAMAIADRIAVMSDGQLLQVDTPEKLYQSPCNSFVAQFVGGANYFGEYQRCMQDYRDSFDLTLEGGLLTLPRALKFDECAYVRAEQIKIVSKDSAQLVGVVENIVFQGTHYRLKIAGVSYGSIIVDVDRHTIGNIRKGEQVGIGVDEKDVLIVPKFKSRQNSNMGQIFSMSKI